MSAADLDQALAISEALVRSAQRADWDDQRLLDAMLGDLRPLPGLTGEPDFLRIDRHTQALPQ